MKKYTFLITILLTLLLAGCGDFKDAIAGINSKANEAAQAIGEDVHSLRSIEITIPADKKISINDLIKTVVRDVQWKYEGEEFDILHINGTWQEGLFSNYSFNAAEKSELKEHGKVQISFFFDNHILIQEKTVVELSNKDQLILSLQGVEAVNQLIKDYTSRQ